MIDDEAEKIKKLLEKNTCPVCGNKKPPMQKYCTDCGKYKELADNLRKLEARRRAFGELL